MMATLHDKSDPYEEVLERIVDRGIVLDGLSSLAAATNKTGQSIQATAYCSITPDPEKSAAVMFPPRKRQRE